MSRAEDFMRYLELSEWIRELSTPELTGVKNAKEYVKKIGVNYQRMRELNRTGVAIVQEHVYPSLAREEKLSEEEVRDLFDFCAGLLDPVRIESVDTVLRYKIAVRLKEDAEEKNDTAQLIRALDILIECCYLMILMTARMYPATQAVEEYRREGMEACLRLCAFLEHDAFAALPDAECKEIILVNARYICAMFEGNTKPYTVEENEEHLALMRRALALADDPFYLDEASKYDWKRHRYRALQGIASLTDYHNAQGFTKEQLKEINAHTRHLIALYKQDKVLYGALSSPDVMNLMLYRNAYLSGETSLKTYRKQLLELTRDADKEDFSHDGNMKMVFAQTEYLLTLNPEKLSEQDQEWLQKFYRDLVQYVTLMPKLGSLTILLSYLSHALDGFIETKDGMRFGTICKQLLAAINPPTWRHCLIVAELSVCIAGHLYEREPSLFSGVSGYPDREKVLSFIHEAAQLHDVGKLYIAEAVTNYTRNYFNDEHEMLLSFPAIGANLLSSQESTRPYAEIARNHMDHTWDKDIATQIVSYADRMGWVTRDGEEIARVQIPFIDAMCREESIAKELDAIVDGRKQMEQVYEMLREQTGEH